MRDLDDYAQRYDELPFEPVQANLRRRHVLSRIRRREPRRLLEIGCGWDPLFTDLGDTEVVVIEPATPFAEAARRRAAGRSQVTVIQELMERVGPAHPSGALAEPFDMIIASSVLHEVPDPQRLLSAVHVLCGRRTTLHVVVPNAGSLHRRLGAAMGLLDSRGAGTPTQELMQQRSSVYDGAGLARELREGGFDVREAGGLLLKPFSHVQMQHLVLAGLLTTPVLDGLDRLGEQLPDLASEIWVEAQISEGIRLQDRTGEYPSRQPE